MQLLCLIVMITAKRRIMSYNSGAYRYYMWSSLQGSMGPESYSDIWPCQKSVIAIIIILHDMKILKVIRNEILANLGICCIRGGTSHKSWAAFRIDDSCHCICTPRESPSGICVLNPGEQGPSKGRMWRITCLKSIGFLNGYPNNIYRHLAFYTTIWSVKVQRLLSRSIHCGQVGSIKRTEEFRRDRCDKRRGVVNKRSSINFHSIPYLLLQSWPLIPFPANSMPVKYPASKA